MHTDEAVHAVKLGTLLEKGIYTYDPHEYHGPTPYYFAVPFLYLSGARSLAEIPSEIPLRIVPALFGVGLVLLLFLFRDGLGQRSAAVAGCLTALSPAMVFYGRYYIQEMLLVFFTFAAIVAGWRYTRAKRFGWALLAGASLGFMHATKETCVLAYLAMLGAGALTVLWTRWVDGHRLDFRDRLHPWHLAFAAKAAVLVSILFLTAFLSNPAATLDIVRTFASYMHRAETGDGSTGGAALHVHPWYFYLQLLLFFRNGPGPWWSEGLILALALAGIVKALRRRHQAFEANVHLLRFLAFYTILMTVGYSIIPYKTPWCLLGFLHGMILLAGVGALAIFLSLPGRFLKASALLVFMLGCTHLGAQAYRGNFDRVFCADPRNPYVYAQTSTNLPKLHRRLEDLAQVHEDGRAMTIKIMAPGGDYWPLPWYLRRFPHVGYWSEVPKDPSASVVITTPELEESLNEAGVTSDTHQTEYYGLRFEVLMVVYIERALWDAFMATRSGPRE